MNNNNSSVQLRISLSSSIIFGSLGSNYVYTCKSFCLFAVVMKNAILKLLKIEQKILPDPPTILEYCLTRKRASESVELS